jgi:TonB family protein
MLSGIVLPKFLHQRPLLPEVTTIDLMNISDPSASNEPAAPAPKQEAKQAPKAEAKPEPKPEPKPEVAPPETIKPVETKQIPPPPEKPAPVPEAVKPEPVAPPAPPDAISLKPLKQKVKKEIKELPDPKVENTKVRKEELKNIAKQLQEEAKKETAAQETIRQQRQLAAAREEERRAELEARIAAAEAKNALRDQLRASNSAASSAATGQQSSANNAQMGILEQQYYATIMSHVQQHWQPPDVKTWNPNLLAVVSIVIASDGRIVNQNFEQPSGDKLFDQFVLKTLEASNPLPPPPAALQKQRLEIGLNFKPSGIQ